MPDVEGGGFYALAVEAAQQGLTAAAWIRSLQAAGTGIRRQVALRIFAEAKVTAAETGEEPGRPLDQVPTLAESPPSPTRSREGVLQTVRLLYREKVTGQLRTVYWSTITDNGITRQDAINQAIDAYEPHAIEYRQTLLGAVHTSSRRLVPVQVAA